MECLSSPSWISTRHYMNLSAFLGERGIRRRNGPMQRWKNIQRVIIEGKEVQLRTTFTQNEKKSTDDTEKPSIVNKRPLTVVLCFILKEIHVDQ